MNTIQEILQLTTSFLLEKGIDQSRRQAEEIIADSLSMPRLELYLQYDRPLQEKELENCRKSLVRRSKGEPPQYIRGFVEFFDCCIHVDPRVLIPRQETEILVERVAKELGNLELNEAELWDICTGSGCIGISIKKRFPELKVSLSDLSQDALDVARYNSEENKVKVELLKGDLLDPFRGRKAHFVVCNPPYIAENEFDRLATEVRNYEPYSALISGKSGLEFYNRLQRELPQHLHSGARIWFEIGHCQGKELLEIFSGPQWKNTAIHPDWAGKDRFFMARYVG